MPRVSQLVNSRSVRGKIHISYQINYTFIAQLTVGVLKVFVGGTLQILPYIPVVVATQVICWDIEAKAFGTQREVVHSHIRVDSHAHASFELKIVSRG